MDGSIEIDEKIITSQNELCRQSVIANATKHFDLNLNDFGPYRVRYTANGRNLLLGGYRGHLASFEWFRKRLSFEINAMESIHDLCFLHNDKMCAVAQKSSVFVYDNQGIELHCLKKLERVLCMDFLPYHFLLVTANERSYLNWLDVTMGATVGNLKTNLGPIKVMAQNPYNAIVCLGDSKGVVSMWSPNARKPLVKMLCHPATIADIAINRNGKYLATAGFDGRIKIWDLRNLDGPLQQYYLRSAASGLEFSQTDMLAVVIGDQVKVYKDCCLTKVKHPFLSYKASTKIANVKFCNYDDVLGIGHQRGFTSIIVPGSSASDFDHFESNPYETKKQRTEHEVKQLLDKISHELISLDPTEITNVHVPTLKEKIEKKKEQIFLKPPKIDFTSKKKTYSSVKKTKVKKIVRETEKMKFVKSQENERIRKAKKAKTKATKSKSTETDNVLDRFKSK